MTKKIMGLGLLLAVAIPVMVGAAVFKTGENVVLNEAVTENLYAVGGMVRQTAPVTGDLLVAGGNLYLNASTTKDLMAVGGQVEVSGDIGDDLRLVGGNLTLRSRVAGDVALVAGSVVMMPETTVAGDLSIAAGQVALDGVVNGDVVIRAGEITLGEGTVIVGKLSYYASQEIAVPSGAQIQGGIDYHPIKVPVDRETGAALLGVVGLTWLLFKLLTLFLTAWVLSAILGAAAPSLIASTVDNFWSRLGYGFVFLVVAPILAVLLLVSVVGLPLGLGLLFLCLFLILLAYIFTVIFTGSWLFKKLNKRATYEANWKTAALGALAVTILAWIPVLGWIAYLILFLVSLAALGSLLLGWLRANRR